MAQENEQKYLVQSAQWRKQARRGQRFRQGYLSTDPERSVRVRADSDKAVITIKGAPANVHGLKRAEFEYPIPLADADELLKHICRQPLIEKTRFRLPQNGHVWEIDQFDKENKGLVLAEIETSNGRKPRRLPAWVGQDVSGDDRYTNAKLAEHPYAEWREHAAKPQSKYHWKSGEGISEGLQRIVSEQLNCAIWHLAENPKSLDEAVHEARKSLKKARSALRLMRASLGDEYGKWNAALRDAGRKLSPVRDAQALIEMFDELNGKYRDKLGDRSLTGMRDGLVARKEQLSRDFQRKRVRGNVLKTMRDVANRIRKWGVDEAGLQTLSRGFAATISRNREAFGNAYGDPTPESFHEWRKRAKDLRYHLGLVAKAWPPVLDGFADATKELEGKLGDDHNLVVLRNTILQKPDNFGKQEEIQAYLDVVDDRQRKIRAEAKILAARLYSDKPRVWRRRLERAWNSWKEEAG
ncbi:MAG TPA: CHAD domain-containing protein [Bryobacteraceae bacterium]|nr:CHAD domain-containing protein [Bryobacteraceae bacterium]